MTKPETEDARIAGLKYLHDEGMDPDVHSGTMALRGFMAGWKAAPASPPAPSVPDVVREWEALTWNRTRLDPSTKGVGDRMAAALGVSEANRVMWHDLAKERLGEMQRLEAKSTAQAAEVERLTGERARYVMANGELGLAHVNMIERSEAAESSLETARGALEYIIQRRALRPFGADSTDTATLDAICSIAGAALVDLEAALPSPPITKIKGEG